MTAVSEKTHIVFEKSFSNKSDIEEVLQQLHDAKETGVLMIHIRSGGIGAVTFEERVKLTETNMQKVLDT